MTLVFWLAVIVSLVFVGTFIVVIFSRDDWSMAFVPVLQFCGAVATVAWLIFIPWFALHTLGIDVGRTTW